MLEAHERQCPHVYDVHKALIESLKAQLDEKSKVIKQLNDQIDEDKDSYKINFKSIFS